MSKPTRLKDPPSQQAYAPRRSNRVSTDLAQSDGETWQERLAVCEGVTNTGEPKLLIRSYYRNIRTKERVWDEPPSGASNIKHATPEMRKMAETQMKGLQQTLDLIPSEENSDNKDKKSPGKKGKKKSGGLFGLFGKKKEEKTVDDAKDLNLQRAIARSMADQHGRGSDEPVVYYDPENNTSPITEEDEMMQMATALSMSESGHQGVTDEEMLQQALEESRREAGKSNGAGVAAIPNTTIQDNFHLAPVPSSAAHKRDPSEEDYLDQKMPAKESDPAKKFDPYAGNGSSSPSQPQLKDPPPLATASDVSPPQKLEADEDRRKPGRSVARRVFGGRKNMEDQAGVV